MLFNKLRRRFREIELEVAIPELALFGMTSTISLVPRFKGGAHVEGIKYAQPVLDLRAAKLVFSAHFDTGMAGLGETVRRALEAALRSGLWKGRTFFMDPIRENPKEQPKSIKDFERTRVLVKIEGGEVPGLTFPEMRTVHEGWKTYIPPGRERTAIELALAVEAARESRSIDRAQVLEEELSEALEGLDS